MEQNDPNPYSAAHRSGVLARETNVTSVAPTSCLNLPLIEFRNDIVGECLQKTEFLEDTVHGTHGGGKVARGRRGGVFRTDRHLVPRSAVKPPVESPLARCWEILVRKVGLFLGLLNPNRNRSTLDGGWVEIPTIDQFAVLIPVWTERLTGEPRSNEYPMSVCHKVRIPGWWVTLTVGKAVKVV